MAATIWCLKQGPTMGRTLVLFVGAQEGLVLFRNELTHIFLAWASDRTHRSGHR